MENMNIILHANILEYVTINYKVYACILHASPIHGGVFQILLSTNKFVESFIIIRDLEISTTKKKAAPNDCA
jgi:hypothetical protein